MSRSERYRNEAKRAGLWAVACALVAIATAAFAYLARLNHMALPMGLSAFASLGFVIATCIKVSFAHGKFNEAERESYWEHRRYMDQFQHVERI